MHTTRRDGIVISGSVTLAVSMVVVALRFISRAVVVGVVGLDDWFMLFSLVFLAAYTISDFVGCSLGMGLHNVDVPRQNIETLIKLVVANGTLYHFAIYFAKASILVFYFKFIPRDTYTRVGCWAVLHLLSVMLFINFIVYFLQCTPFEKIFSPEVPGTCVDLSVFLYVSATVGILTDIAIFILPLRWLNTIQRTRTERNLVIALFGFSLVGCIISIARIPAIREFSPSDDIMYTLFRLDIWSHIEVTVCIICGSAPALKPLFVKIKNRNRRQESSKTLTSDLELSRSFYDLNRRSGKLAGSTLVESRDCEGSC